MNEYLYECICMSTHRVVCLLSSVIHRRSQLTNAELSLKVKEDDFAIYELIF